MEDGSRLVRWGILLAVATAGGSVVAGCSGDSSDGAASSGCPAIRIGANHGHSLTVPMDHVAGAGAIDYSIQGTADHDHIVALAGDEYDQLARGETVTVTSWADDWLDGWEGHTHEVTIRCP